MHKLIRVILDSIVKSVVSKIVLFETVHPPFAKNMADAHHVVKYSLILSTTSGIQGQDVH